MKSTNILSKSWQKISSVVINPFIIRSEKTIKEVGVYRCAWFWCVYTIDGTDRLLLRRLPVNVFSYIEAVDIAQAHIGLPRREIFQN